MSMQYTIRAIPENIDRALRQRAESESRSLNAVAIDALAVGLNLGPRQVKHHDLDHLSGTWVEDPAFDEAMVEFERIDPEDWK